MQWRSTPRTAGVRWRAGASLAPSILIISVVLLTSLLPHLATWCSAVRPDPFALETSRWSASSSRSSSVVSPTDALRNVHCMTYMSSVSSAPPSPSVSCALTSNLASSARTSRVTSASFSSLLTYSMKACLGERAEPVAWKRTCGTARQRTARRSVTSESCSCSITRRTASTLNW